MPRNGHATPRRLIEVLEWARSRKSVSYSISRWRLGEKGGQGPAVLLNGVPAAASRPSPVGTLWAEYGLAGRCLTSQDHGGHRGVDTFKCSAIVSSTSCPKFLRQSGPPGLRRCESKIAAIFMRQFSVILPRGAGGRQIRPERLDGFEQPEISWQAESRISAQVYTVGTL